MSLAIVIGSLAPYTARAYEAFAERCREDVHVFTCARLEPHRVWEIGEPHHFRHSVLPGIRWHRDYVNHVYANPSVVTQLARLKPETVLVGGFSPTMALAVGYARGRGIPYGIATDGTLSTDPGEQSVPHRLMRRAMVPAARYGVCASDDSVKLLERWGLKPGRGVVVPLVSAWDAPPTLPDFSERPFDILIAGGISERIKGVLFFADVMERLAAQGRRLRVRVTGKGPQRAELEARLTSAGIEAHFDGPIQPSEMPAVMASAKLLLFPSRQDTWGLVANEAVLCGTPVLGSPHATSSPAFVERFGLGLVRPLAVDAWADAVLDMLSSEARWSGFMVRRDAAIDWFSLDAAVAGLKQAFDLGRTPSNRISEAHGAARRVGSG